MRNIKTKFKLFAVILITFNLYSYTQTLNSSKGPDPGPGDDNYEIIDTCTSIISGNIHGHLEPILACPPILITSRGTARTHITGIFNSDEEIKITSGVNGVRLLPASHAENLNTKNALKTHGYTHIKVKRPNGSPFSSFKKSKEINVRVYQDPTRNNLQIKAVKSIERIDVFDIYGKSILGENYNNTNKGTSLNLKPLKKGIYIIKIKLEDDSIITKTIINE